MSRSRIISAVPALFVLFTAGCGGGGAADGDVAFRSAANADIDTGALPTPPAVVVTPAGDVVLPAPDSAQVEGQLLPTFWTVPVTPVGLQRLLDAPSSFVPFSGPADLHYAELAKIVGATELGDLAFYLPDEYLFQSIPAASVAADRAVVQWPEFASVALADATTCQRLPEIEVGEVFETAADGSLFEDDGLLYEVIAVPAVPGATC